MCINQVTNSEPDLCETVQQLPLVCEHVNISKQSFSRIFHTLYLYISQYFGLNEGKKICTVFSDIFSTLIYLLNTYNILLNK